MEDSDIDIAVYGDFSPFEFLEIASELQDITGKAVYIKDREKHAEYVMYISSMYLTLEEDRKVVIDAIIKRGRVYGKNLK